MVFPQERYIYLRKCLREESPLHHLLISFDTDVLCYHTSQPRQEQNLFTSTTSRSRSRALKSGLLWLGFWTEVSARSSQLRKNKHENLPFTHSLVGRRGRLNIKWEEDVPSSWEAPTASPLPHWAGLRLSEKTVKTYNAKVKTCWKTENKTCTR